ncbi:MAG: hypothetical protein ABFC62_08700 [Clostridiaceae bacterium]|nr:hypothetical protein [Eubacteriales bacterium]
MKQRRNRRKTRRRRGSFRASNWFPFAMLFLSVAGILGVAALVVFVGLPKVLPYLGVEYRAPFLPAPTPSPTPAPTPTPNPMDSFNPMDAQSEVIFDGSTSYTWFGDPYFYKGTLLISAGKVVDTKATMTSLYFYYPDKGRTAEELPYQLKNKHFMYARFNDDWIVYLDAKLDGGGFVTVVDRSEPGAAPIIIKEVFAGQPELMLDGNYLAWTERTGSKMDKLFVCDLKSRETTTVQMFNNNVYGQSKPSLRNGVLIWADPDEAAAGATTSAICSVALNGSPTVKTYRPGTFVHDPQGDGTYTAWLDGCHGPDTRLYYCKGNGSAVEVDSGVVDFGLGGGFVAYSKESAIYVYKFGERKAYRITPEKELAQFLGVSDGKVLWMDVTTRERDIVKFAPIP